MNARRALASLEESGAALDGIAEGNLMGPESPGTIKETHLAAIVRCKRGGFSRFCGCYSPVGAEEMEGTRTMSKNNPTPGGRAKKNTDVSLIRSSAAEYLTFVAAGGNSEASVEMRYEDENIWLTQKMMAALYDVSVPAINQHLKRIFSDNELQESSVVKQYLTTAADGNPRTFRIQPLGFGFDDSQFHLGADSRFPFRHSEAVGEIFQRGHR